MTRRQTFSAWLRQLDDDKLKKAESFDMEVHRVAANKANERLSQLHQYEDGTVDQPILNADTLIEEEEI